MTGEKETVTAGKTLEDLAGERRGLFGGIIGEYFGFLRHSKKWWLGPIIVVLLLFGVIVALGGGIAAPFIYTLF